MGVFGRPRTRTVAAGVRFEGDRPRVSRCWRRNRRLPESGRRRRSQPGASPSWRAGSRPTAPATTTPPRRRCAARSARTCAARTGRCSCSPRASSTTATTARRAKPSRRWRAAADARRRWRRSASPTACGWRAIGRRRPPATGGSPRRRRRAPVTPRWRASASPRWPPTEDRDAARAQFLAIARDFPAHPLADEALRRLGAGTPATPLTTPPHAAGASDHAAATPPPSDLAPGDRLRRAESLSKDRHWDEALAELAKLPATLPPDLAAERDYQIGMTKFRMRRDYPTAGTLLLGAVDQLARVSGDKAASAQFHGARALSRVDRDDEAIAGYRKVIAQFPHSRWAAEAQYLSGWLEYNRGRFRESIPAFQATLDRYGSSAFADDAAWSLAFANFLLGNTAEAAAGLDRYGRLAPTGIASDEIAGRVKYWRARLKEKAGQKDEAEAGYRELAQRGPFSFYGLLARARLKQAGQTVPIELPVKKVAVETPSKPLREPSVARADRADRGGDDRGGGRGDRAEREGDPEAPGRRQGAALVDRSLQAREQLPPRLPAGRVARRRRARRRPAARRRHARDVGGGVSARVSAAGREVRRRRRQPGAVPLRDHAQGIGVRSAQRLVRRRARPAADDPADQHAGRGGDRRAVLSGPALRSGDQRPAGRQLHRPALHQVRPRAAADRGRLQRRAAHDGALVRAKRQVPDRRIRRADRLSADARIRRSA